MGAFLLLHQPLRKWSNRHIRWQRNIIISRIFRFTNMLQFIFYNGCFLWRCMQWWVWLRLTGLWYAYVVINNFTTTKSSDRVHLIVRRLIASWCTCLKCTLRICWGWLGSLPFSLSLSASQIWPILSSRLVKRWSVDFWSCKRFLSIDQHSLQC